MCAYTALSVEVLVDYEVPCDYEYPSPPYYRPCTPISLRCEARGASGRVNYRWSSTNSASFVSGGTNMTVSTDMLTYLDGGLHTCCALDAQGNSGCDRVEIVVKGVLKHYSTNLLSFMTKRFYRLILTSLRALLITERCYGVAQEVSEAGVSCLCSYHIPVLKMECGSYF